jgi:DNA mismatch endonuclease (patch repair protein)
MADIVDAAKRSQMMSGIRSRNTKPELLLRQGLTALGVRYRLHRTDLPGSPDFAFIGRKAAVFAHGCFWHGHDCHLFRIPATRADFWTSKIERNRRRDEEVLHQLGAMGWRALVVWECSTRGRCSLGKDEVALRVAEWLQKGTATSEIRGTC